MTNVKCTTDLNVTGKYTTSFTWTIKRLKGRVEEYFLDRVLSNEFNVEGSEGRTTKWMLELLPNNANFSLSGFPQLLLGLHSKLDFITMQDPHFQHQILSSSLSFCSLHTEFVVLVLRQKYSSEESPKSPPRVSNLLLNHRTKNANFLALKNEC